MPSVLFFILCLLSAIACYFLKIRGVRTAYIWMVLVFICISIWFTLILFPIDRLSPLIIKDWLKFRETSINLHFAFTSQNWLLVLSLFTINISFLLTGIARLDIKSDLKNWIFQLLLIAFSFLALISADLWSVVLLWTALDLLELSFHRLVLNDANEKVYFRKFIVKSIGSIILIWNIAFLSKSGFNPLINGIVSSSPNTSIFLASLMHSGILPLNVKSRTLSEEKSSDLLKQLFDVINFLVSFSLVSNLQVTELPFVLSFVISIGSYILIIFSSMQWALAKDNSQSFDFFLLYETGIFIFLYLSGAARYIIFLLVMLTISIMWLKMFSHRSKSLLVFPVICLFLITGLPLSLNAYGPRGFIGEGLSVGLIVSFSAHILLIFGFLRRAFDGNEKFHDLESWYQVAYLIGLFLPFQSAAAIIFKSKIDMAVEFQHWWIGLVMTILGISGYLFSGRKINKQVLEINNPQKRPIFQFLSFDWIFDNLTFFENRVWGFVNRFSGLMEGEGGIMWALVFLILIFSLLS